MICLLNYSDKFIFDLKLCDELKQYIFIGYESFTFYFSFHTLSANMYNFG